MRLLLDENVATPIAVAIRNLVDDLHEVTHVLDLDGWKGAKDLALWPMAANEGFEAVLTNDAKQMQRSHEVEAIAHSGIHRIQYPHKHPGLTGTGIAIATVCAALPKVLDLLSGASAQHLVTLTGVDPTPAARYKLCVPAETPPKFWPSA
ncbi:hypothetical protein GCM10027589_00490 [Actinocorallia lasiicapitis]